MKQFAILTDHSVKLDKNYYYPTEEDMLSEYLKVVDDLTINEENRLRRENLQLKAKTDKFDMLHDEISDLKKQLGLE